VTIPPDAGRHAPALQRAGVVVFCSAVDGTIKAGKFWQQINAAIDAPSTLQQTERR
jgi:hypothetical protein